MENFYLLYTKKHKSRVGDSLEGFVTPFEAKNRGEAISIADRARGDGNYHMLLSEKDSHPGTFWIRILNLKIAVIFLATVTEQEYHIRLYKEGSTEYLDEVPQLLHAHPDEKEEVIRKALNIPKRIKLYRFDEADGVVYYKLFRKKRLPIFKILHEKPKPKLPQPTDN